MLKSKQFISTSIFFKICFFSSLIKLLEKPLINIIFLILYNIVILFTSFLFVCWCYRFYIVGVIAERIYYLFPCFKKKRSLLLNISRRLKYSICCSTTVHTTFDASEIYQINKWIHQWIHKFSIAVSNCSIAWWCLKHVEVIQLNFHRNSNMFAYANAVKKQGKFCLIKINKKKLAKIIRIAINAYAVCFPLLHRASMFISTLFYHPKC